MTSAPRALCDPAEPRKARGAFFTPEPVARFVTDWAVRRAGDHVLEPSCGEASFLLAAIDRRARLRGAEAGPAGALDGVEVHGETAETARRRLRRAGVDARIQVGDFFAVEPTGAYHAVVGNPPYVRYQEFSGEARTRSRAAALRAGVRLTSLASSWAAFTVHSALFLRPGGRLGLVLPAELLSVNYAADVRRFLLGSFARVEIVLFTERVFPGVLADVVLLLADGYRRGSARRVHVRQARNASGLAGLGEARVWRPVSPAGKWTNALLPDRAAGAYLAVLSGPGFVELESWGDTTLGMVTGNNRFFALSPARAAELGLAPEELLPLSPPGSRHLRGLALEPDALGRLGAAGAATRLFRPSGDPSPAATAYLRSGERAGVPLAFKCRSRRPWWRVPLAPPAELLLTYMNADAPRLIANSAGAHHLNSVHGVYLRPGVAAVGRPLLPLGSLSSITLVGAETVGRAYGGGILKLEPREADRLPVPSPDLLAAARADLESIRPSVADALRAGRLGEAVAAVDAVLLSGHLGVPAWRVRAVREAHQRLRRRRMTRGREARTSEP